MMKVVMLVTAILALQGDSPSLSKREKEIIQTEIAWHNAYVNHDPIALGKVLADEYVTISSRGKTSTKADEIKGLKADKTHYEYSRPRDMNIRFYQDVAVVVGKTDEKGTAGSKPYAASFAWTDVFIKRDGRWQCVSAQVARISD